MHDYLFTTIMVKGLKKIIDMGLNKLIKNNINKQKERGEIMIPKYTEAY